MAINDSPQSAYDHWPHIFDQFEQHYRESRSVRASTTPRLNILKIFGISRRELRHSQALAWFLDENESHEQGGLFLRSLLALLDLPDTEFTAYQVDRERPARVDISIYKRSGFAIFIENKVDHFERAEQFSDLQTSLVTFSAINQIPPSHRFAVFLTDDGRCPETASAELPGGLVAKNCCAISRIALFEKFADSLQDVKSKSPLLVQFLHSYVQEISALRHP